MHFLQLAARFSVVQIADAQAVDLTGEYVFLSKMDDELSLVCETRLAPKDVINAEHGWKGLKIVGVLDFGLVGIIAGISARLADANISVFVVSTYNTDYIFLKEAMFDRATQVLRDAGYEII